jgi:type II secretory ATPase GspE/PulE/Tfp pilus assembly ATPase PilB-like protein
LPIVKLLDDIIQGAVNSGASDIHIEPQFPEMAVRYRVDGILHDIMTIPKQAEALIVSRVKVLANMDITESRRPQDGHIRVDKEGREYDIRVSTVLTVNGENVVMRILDKGSLLLGLDRLGLSGRDAQVFSSLITKPYGMILVTGPTGSGKTTTLYAVLNQIDSLSRNVITIEDPVEYRLERITQIQVDAASNMTFASGLRTMLRQDPDIVMVGEIRDKETANQALQAALTGHLVLSTLHTNDTASSITRLLELDLNPHLVSSTLVGVIAQRLVRRVCDSCKQEVFLTQDQMATLDIRLPPGEEQSPKIFQGQGCVRCRGTGLYGRTAIFEILRVTDPIRRLINERADAVEIKRAAKADGTISLREAAVRKLAEGTTSYDEVIRVTLDEG